MTEQLSLRSCKRAPPSLQVMQTGHRSQGAGCTLSVHKKAFMLLFSFIGIQCYLPLNQAGVKGPADSCL